MMCRLRDHVWKPTRSNKFDRCEKCRTFFPCKHECSHLDCICTRAGRGHELDPDIKLPGWPLKEDPFAEKERTTDQSDPKERTAAGL